MKMKYSKARRIRIQLGAKCPCVIYWRSRNRYWRGYMKQQWCWTLFARNGRVQDSSSESFSSKYKAIENYNTTYDLMKKLGRFMFGYRNAGHHAEER